MIQRIISSVWIAAALALTIGPSALAQDKPAKAGAAASKSGENKAKAAQPRLLDINSASKTELKKLPGVGDAEADRIIAGRPYLTKAHLLTRGIVPGEVYGQISALVVANQKPEYLEQAARKKS